MLKIFNRRETRPEEERQDYEWSGGVWLTTVNNTLDADILESKLRGEGIPCNRKYIGSAQYMEVLFGNNLTGDIELYVPQDRLEDALCVIRPIDLDDCEEPEEEPEKE